MYGQQMELSYRRTALAGATPIGLMIALYDTLSGNLRRAALALTNNDIERRCAELNHAYLVIGQLESMVDAQNGGELAGSLTLFYTHLRAKMLEASIKKSARLLEEQIELVLQIRSAWQQRESAASSSVPAELLPAPGAPVAERRSFSQSI